MASFSGDLCKLFDSTFDDSLPLIDKVLYEHDHALLLGKEKTGKTILSIQLGFCLTSQEPLFGKFDVHKPCTVFYLRLEGKPADTQKMMKSMARVIDVEKSRFYLHHTNYINLDTDEGCELIKSVIDSWQKPDIIIIDPLYMAMKGSLESATESRAMIANLRSMSTYYNSTLIINHHSHRAYKVKGRIIEEGDDSIFGSFVWKAYPDNILLFEHLSGRGLKRKLSCKTQRMGQMLKEEELILIEPQPLFFRLSSDHHAPSVDKVRDALKEGPANTKELAEKVGVYPTTVYNAIKDLLTQEVVECTNLGHHPKVYKLKV